MAQSNTAATSALIVLYQKDPIDIAALQRCVLEGASVLVSHQTVFSLQQPVLHALLHRQEVEGVEACLQSPLALDWKTRTNYRAENAFHLLCSVRSPEKAVQMLRLLVRRVETHPLDTVEWSQSNVFGHDFIHLAAQTGKLSLFWPEVAHLPFFADRVTQLSLNGLTHMQVFRVDWAALSEAEQACFNVTVSPAASDT